MMKTKHYVALAAMAFAALSSCTNQGAILASGIDKSNMDLEAVPGDDFFQYACGGWNAKHPLTDEYSRYGTFETLIENNEKQIHELIEEVASKEQIQGTAAQKIRDVYNLAMDSVTLNKQGYEPIKSALDMIASMNDKAQITPMMTELINMGVNIYFNSYVYADPKNSNLNIFQMAQGGLSLGEREYYLENDNDTKAIRAAYKEYAKKLFVLTGSSEYEAARKANDVLDIETAIAEKSLSAKDRRNPEANYHKMSYMDLKNTIKGIDWDAYLKGLGVEAVNELNVEQIEPIQMVGELIMKQPVSKHVSYMQFNLIDAAASYMSDDFAEAKFDFYGRTLSGKKVNRARWKRSVGVVDNLLGELVGQLYVEKYFPKAAKERMVKLVKNLQVALGERINSQEWMSQETKTKALEKLSLFHVKVGYPDTWKDYSALDIKSDSYWANVCRASQWSLKDNISRLGKEVDKDEWLMTPQTVNAYYNPSTNEICFPAAILQKPFFNMEADDAANYGAIGVVIGHEMTHGFDDQGRRYDKDGNMKDWWTEEDAAKFTERADVMVNFFGNINVLPDLKANGELTLGENLADHGGLNVAFTAFRNATKNQPLSNVDGFTPEQRFFLAYSLLWAGNIRDEQIKLYTNNDPHSLGRWRVNGALPHIQAWYDAFNITPENKLYIAPEERVNIW